MLSQSILKNYRQSVENLDGYYFDVETFERAMKLAKYLPDTLFVYACPDGSFQFEYYDKLNRRIEIVVERDQIFYSYSCDGDYFYEDMVVSFNEAVQMINKFVEEY